ncbi:MAG TPA: glycoside hydrolase family 140 protein [Candidatus Paceibacterota bacterium]|nr:glycoside hydrolase family 140 protein [Verrucomicrobiota bacterium]HRZ46755.1 glycoside hydrolase family 140 protein [Candidatus Paceibacterota bacterium]HRZ92365.1 glycoside hydrolase family 140 protein [Candidatus Paceibacterota bacterium]
MKTIPTRLVAVRCTNTSIALFRWACAAPAIAYILILNQISAPAASLLRVSDNHRYIVAEDGKPFFYLADTAWELFHRLNREEADRYLENRARLGFTVIQAVALAELDGLGDANAYGHRPLIERRPDRPDVKEGPANDYWDHVDYIVDRAKSLGLWIGFLPTWGDKWHARQGAPPPVFTPANAEAYGLWLGRRYRDKPIIWILGGDRPVSTDEEKGVLRALARGLQQGDQGRHLLTFHPPGGQGSSQWFHSDDWLDFNMRQNGHVIEFTGRYDQTRKDYDRTPIKPVIDGEPVYEDHPISFRPGELGHTTAADVRRPIYWDLFSGACGHTYGHHSVWQMWQPGRRPINGPLLPWHEAIHQPGAAQMQYARRLLESRPFLTRIPDDAVIVAEEVATSIPGAGTRRFVATRDEKGAYAMVYAPLSRTFRVRLDKIAGEPVQAWWFNPRNGTATAIGSFPNRGIQAFTPPTPGELLDWVLVLDDSRQSFPPPGAAPLP